MRYSSVLLTSLLALFTFAQAHPCRGAAITLQNPSFESPIVADSIFFSDPDGWSETGDATARGLFNPNGFDYPGASSGLPLPGTASGFQLGIVRDPTSALFQNVG